MRKLTTPIFATDIFALCAASTCKPTGGQIMVNRNRRTATFPEADCKCPVPLSPSIANLAGVICTVLASRRDGAKSGRVISPDRNIPQEITNWVPTLPEAAAPPLFCRKRRNSEDKAWSRRLYRSPDVFKQGNATGDAPMQKTDRPYAFTRQSNGSASLCRICCTGTTWVESSRGRSGGRSPQ